MLRYGLSALGADEGVAVLGVSGVYETEAHTLDEGETQPPYLNAVAHVETVHAPLELLSVLQDAERGAGRVRSSRRWQARPLDLDLLTYGDAVLRMDRLTLPHPRLAERRFVLEPWAEIAPNLVLPPPFERTVAALLRRCDDAAQIERTELRLEAPF
jgi:2-amino-4-hydroxy-6-hydroxymethyldihydropteridine diphosphokinase